MTKKIIQDVILKTNNEPPKKPEVKTFSPPKKENDKIEQNPFFKERAVLQNKETYLPPEWTEKSRDLKPKKLLKWLLILATMGIALFIILKIISVFSTVDIKITPKQKTLPVSLTLMATEQDDSDHLNFQVAEMSYESTKEVPASGKEDLQQKASGIVVIFNNNSKTQSLVTETRLESPEGYIYKTEKSLTIPAKGSVAVKVFADKPGQEYNVGLTDFKLPGFKGTPKYETVIGRSQTDISGGYVGQASVLSDADFNKAKEELRSEITQYLKDSITAETPAGFLAYPGSIKIEFAASTENPRAGELNKNFAITESAAAKVYLVKKEELDQKITEAYLEQLTPANPLGFRVSNLDKLDFALKNASEDGKTIEFTIKGSAIFVWKVDKDSLIGELESVGSAKYKDILSNHPEIENAEIIFNPSWWKLMPEDEGRIKYEEKLPI